MPCQSESHQLTFLRAPAGRVALFLGGYGYGPAGQQSLHVTPVDRDLLHGRQLGGWRRGQPAHVQPPPDLTPVTGQMPPDVTPRELI